MSKIKTKIKLLSPKAVFPTRANPTDTGYDLTIIGIEKIVGDVIFFKTGISVQPNSGYYFEIVPRSSISKLPLQLANSVGVIDSSYTGEVLIPVRVMHSQLGQELKNQSFPVGFVKIFGLSPATLSSVADLILAKSPKLFQMILRKRYDADFEEVSELQETERGDGGFGSTDLKKE